MPVNASKLYRVSAVIVAALILATLTTLAYVYNNHPVAVADTVPPALTGKPLAAYDDLYPIQVDDQGHLYLDKGRFMQAVRALLANPSEQAIVDLVYLGQQNNITLGLSTSEKNEYQRLARKLSSQELNAIVDRRDTLFRTYKDIVNGIGQTFADTGIEIVLHDTRNPIRSIVAVQNPISGRQIGDPNTNFGVQLIKDYSATNMHGVSYISYPLMLKDGRAVKSTTIPIFDERYGLIGLICLNIDISRLKTHDPAAVSAFVQAMTKVNTQSKTGELIDNAKRASPNAQPASGNNHASH